MRIEQEDILSTGNLELLSRHAVEGFITGYHKSPFHGFSVEFAEHRQYNPGESIKHLDWKLYGRTDRLFVKRYEEETNLRCRIILDASSSMQLKGEATLSKLQYSIWCSAVLLQILKRQRDATGISVFDEEIGFSSRTSSAPRHYKALMAELGRMLEYSSSLKKTKLSDSLHQLANQLHRRSLIVLFTDLLGIEDDDEELFSAIQHLKHNKQELIVFNTLNHPTELELDLGDRPLNFVDLETGDSVKLQANEMRSSYSQSIHKRINELRNRLAQYKVEFIDCDSSAGIEKVMIPFLIKRDRMAR